MRLRFVAGALLAVTLAAPLLAPPRPARACSAGPEFDKVADSEVIVAGRLDRWERAGEARGAGEFVPIRVTMTVERVFKGDAMPTIAIIDHGSLIDYPVQGTGATRIVWGGAGGACGSFDADPTGRYAIMGLRRPPNGTYGANRLLTFFLGDEPVGDGFEFAMNRLVPLQPGRLPRTGAASAELDPAPAVLPTAFGISTLIVAGAILVMPRQERHQRDRHHE
jgi:hypothetical protein